MNSILQFLKTHWRIVLIAAGLLVLVFGVWKIVRWREDAAFTNAIKKQQEIVDAEKTKAVSAKAIAEDAIKEANEAKAIAEQEKQKRMLAEKIFMDSSKTFKEKIQLYEKVKNNPVKPVDSNPDATTDELCERAKRLGVECPDN